MTFFIPAFNLLVSFAVIVMQIVVAAIVLRFLLSKNRASDRYLRFVSRYAYPVSFLIALGGMVLSLIYSDVVGYSVCTLCWYQRILLYPQALLLGLALWRGDRTITDYIIVLSGLGIILAVYQKYVEFGGVAILPCSSTDISCSKIYVLEFGYITIPVMALTSFVFIFTLMLIGRYVTRAGSLRL